MKKLTALSMAALFATAGALLPVEIAQAANAKLSKAECDSLWGVADSAGSGALDRAQAQAYVSDFIIVDADADGKLSAAEFSAGCKKGLVHDSSMSGAGEGASGTAPDAGGAAAPGKKY